MKASTKRNSFFLILTLGFLNALTPFSIDLYLPAFNDIARDLRTAVQRLSLTVSVYFVGFAIGQIFYGPLLDRFGRKRPVYLGLAIYLLASLGCMRAQSIEMLLLFRFISALGGSAASVGATAMVRDLFPPQDAAKVFSMLMLVLSVSPLLAPTVGGFIVTAWGWRALFGILTALGLIDFALVALVLPEAYPPDPSVSLSPGPILKNFNEILRHPRFWVYTFAGSFSFAGLFVYVAGSPSIFMDFFKVSPRVFGAIFASLAVGMIGGGQLNHLLTRKFAITGIFRFALYTQLVICAIFLGASLSGHLTLGSTISFLFSILVCAGVTSPNGSAIALEPFSRNIGSAAALLGFLQLGIGALAASIVGLYDIRGTLPTAAAMALSALLGCAVLALENRYSEP